ncbi:MAG TPA: hypothetical protein VHB48_21285 [Chitinophagaceae bacterium]|nr:hypothetical protein [Chitinophagaceae bacterium]
MKNTQRKAVTNPVDKPREVQQTTDRHITQDFENYPGNPAKEHIIHPKTKTDKLIAAGGEKGRKNKSNPPKQEKTMPGNTTHAEKKLAANLHGKPGSAQHVPNKVKRLKKQEK